MKNDSDRKGQEGLHMIKKILVPIAFSKYSEGILNYAAELAEPVGAELHLVSVINDRDLEAVSKITAFGYKVGTDEYLKIVKKERREKIENLIEKLTLPDDKVSYSFMVGDPTTEILRFIVEQKMDLVVMGIKANEIKHVFAGSVAERMFRKCPVPILSFRGDDIAERLHKRVLKHIIHD